MLALTSKIPIVVLAGKGLILGGSHASNYNLKRSLVGDLLPFWLRISIHWVSLIRCPKRNRIGTTLRKRWKRLRVAPMNKNVTNLSECLRGCWLLSDISHRKSRAQNNLAEVWLIWKCSFMEEWHFTLIVNNTNRLSAVIKCTALELTSTSEGFFRIAKWFRQRYHAVLMIDYRVFYEFIPMEEMKAKSSYSLPSRRGAERRPMQWLSVRLAVCSGIIWLAIRWSSRASIASSCHHRPPQAFINACWRTDGGQLPIAGTSKGVLSPGTNPQTTRCSVCMDANSRMHVISGW